MSSDFEAFFIRPTAASPGTRKMPRVRYPLRSKRAHRRSVVNGLLRRFVPPSLVAFPVLPLSFPMVEFVSWLRGGLAVRLFVRGTALADVCGFVLVPAALGLVAPAVFLTAAFRKAHRSRVASVVFCMLP